MTLHQKRVCRYLQTDKGKLTYRKAHLKYRYNITPDEVAVMELGQKGLCKICNQPETRKNKKTLSIDHCHKTHKVRGLLCGSCNSALGYLKDNADLALRAWAYLLKS